MTLTVHPLPVPAALGPGLDLAAAVLAALDDAAARGELDGPRDGDVLVVASKVVALAEDRLVAMGAVDPADVAAERRRLSLAHARRVVADHPRVLVVETSHGFVCANAGIDTSNVPAGHALLLPEDPDASAATLREDLHAATGASLGVVVGDTFGRPWREGQVDVAVGVAGLGPLRDERGTVDLLGAPLHVTVAAVADEVAGAADLVRDKASPVPFVLLRGLDLAGTGTARDLVRPPAQDLFPAGGATLARHAVTATHPGGRHGGAAPAESPHDLAAEGGDDLTADLRIARARLPDRCDLRSTAATDGTVEVVVVGPRDPATLLAVGAALEDLRILRAGRGLPPGPPRPGTPGGDDRGDRGDDDRGDRAGVLARMTVPVGPAVAQSSTTNAR